MAPTTYYFFALKRSMSFVYGKNSSLFLMICETQISGAETEVKSVEMHHEALAEVRAGLEFACV